MKVLHLLRHAKSSWDEPGLADRDRGLNKRGRRDAPRMGRALAKRIEHALIATSSARRAQLTLEGLGRGWPDLAELPQIEVDDLYTFSGEALGNWITARDDSVSSLFVIGHNPALTVLINALIGKASLDNLPTAGYARLSLDIEYWENLRTGCARLEEILLPRNLEEN